MPRKRKPSGRKRGRARTPKSFDRDAGRKRSPRPRILIVCEGQKTEPNYFHTLVRDFRLTAVKIEDNRGRGSPEQTVDAAINYLRKDKDFDEVWCVFDAESADRRSFFEQAVELAKCEEFKLAVSNPAFEFWLLLHFEETDSPFTNADEVIDKLKLHLDDYEKDYRRCKNLLDCLDEAIERAQWVLENHRNRGDGQFAPNPSTYVHLLVDKLKAIKPR